MRYADIGKVTGCSRPKVILPGAPLHNGNPISILVFSIIQPTSGMGARILVDLARQSGPLLDLTGKDLLIPIPYSLKVDLDTRSQQKRRSDGPIHKMRGGRNVVNPNSSLETIHQQDLVAGTLQLGKVEGIFPLVDREAADSARWQDCEKVTMATIRRDGEQF